MTVDRPTALCSRSGLRYEVALDVIGAVIAHYAEEAGIERERPVSDKGPGSGYSGTDHE